MVEVRFMSVAFIMLLSFGCSLDGSNQTSKNSTVERGDGVKTKGIDTESFTALIQREDSAFLFITADWCGGGTLNLNNFILPQLHDLESREITYFIVYMGEFEKMNAELDSIRSGRDEVTFYHLDDVMNNAFFQKMRLRKILKNLDPDFDFGFAVPFKGMYKEGKIIYQGSPRGYIEE